MWVCRVILRERESGRVCARVCVCMWVYVCVCARVCVWGGVCVWVGVCVGGWVGVVIDVNVCGHVVSAF